MGEPGSGAEESVSGTASRQGSFEQRGEQTETTDFGRTEQHPRLVEESLELGTLFLCKILRPPTQFFLHSTVDPGKLLESGPDVPQQPGAETQTESELSKTQQPGMEPVRVNRKEQVPTKRFLRQEP